MMLGKYSFGIGDRFGHQGKAQLAALTKARQAGVDVTPVWNKSQREHGIIGTEPGDVRREADAAVAACNWETPYFVDADHIRLCNVEHFIEACDFFTLDVADFIGRQADPADVDAFVSRYAALVGALQIDGIAKKLHVTADGLRAIAGKYLAAVRQAGRIYRCIEARKGAGHFITEVSMDETNAPQTPVELLVILAAVADERIPAQTVAPKFSGRFNKGVDYVGDLDTFATEFEQDLAVIAYAVRQFGLPEDLKLSIHSGSDKFSIYEPIQNALKRFGAGLHVKTAGTTWLEELIGLALAGDDGLAIAKEVYNQALARMDELCAPYATVIEIDKSRLPDPRIVANWDGSLFAQALRHDPFCAYYNPHFRQLLHVGYKIAAEMGPRFLEALECHEETIAEQVTTNLYDRHLRPLFVD
ncbi:MAG TPA: tagaturonate epimerase family protein [Sedimentisphaerales bacterium]|nr:tagaturonate epimerase family protein [Sedimentisphaerales bacterium]HRS12699.1 tagaturonate epimerase family protein [Sedimentisphaerales bacterium]HRV49319.1 tagaturonate epimerase family protein [Sedimentisphaerales bacterium]